MQPTLYIHLGQQKTGTSSLQRFCTRNRNALVKRLGILYPTPGGNIPVRTMHRHFSLFPYQEERWKRVRLEIDASSCKTILLSNENLSMTGVDDHTFAAIRALLPEFVIRYIIYVRRIDDACKAWYMQSVKRDNMRTVSYETYVGNQSRHKSYRLYPSRLLQHCEKQVGKGNLIIRIYDPDTFPNRNTVDDVFSILGITLPDDLDRSHRYNPGIPQQALPLLTDTLRRYSLSDPTRVEIYSKLAAAFSERPHTPLPSHIQAEAEKEIERLNADFIPGYKQIFEKKELDFSFAPSGISPQELLIVDLLYSILFELRKKETRLSRLREFLYNRILPHLMALSRLPGRFVQYLSRLFSRQ